MHHCVQGAVSARVNSASCMMGREKRGEGFLVSAKPGFQPPLQNCEADVWQGIRRTSQCLLLCPFLHCPVCRVS